MGKAKFRGKKCSTDFWIKKFSRFFAEMVRFENISVWFGTKFASVVILKLNIGFKCIAKTGKKIYEKRVKRAKRRNFNM